MEAILDAIDSLGNRLGNRIEDISIQLQQHSTMLAAIAKTMQFNSEEIKDCKTNVKDIEKQMEALKKENEDMRRRVLDQERYKRRWCLQIKGKKDRVNENIRAETVELLCKNAPDLATRMEDAVDIVHRPGEATEDRHRQIIILFAKRVVRDDI